MSRVKLSGLLATMALAVAAVAAVPVQAEEHPAGDTAVCSVTGHATITNPIPYVSLTPTSGSYDFTSLTFECRLVGPGDDPVVQEGSYDVSSSGVYNNTGPNCGTGTADASAADTTATGGPEGPISVGYHIDFNGGVGVLQVRTGTDPDTGFAYGTPSHADGTGGTGSGGIVITPTGGDDPTGPNPVTCATGFDVTGSVTLHFDDTE